MRQINHKSLLSIATATTLFACSAEVKSQDRPNILFICIDDLRTELGCYGSEVKSPNLDRLAGESTLFTNHYVSVPTSGASRASMLSGLYPRDFRDTKNSACNFRFAGKPEGENPETLFHALKRGGYYTVGIGKISHNENGMMLNDPTKRQLPHSWDEMLMDNGKWASGPDAFYGYSDGSSRQSNGRNVKPYECADVKSDSDLPDGLTTALALTKLDELAAKNGDKPFCLAVGFFKPHLPFVSPKKYWGMYDEDEIKVSDYDIPQGCDSLGLHQSNEFNRYMAGDEKISLDVKATDGYARKLRHAYYACVSYIDAQVGAIIERLDELGLAENTVVVVWGDHGWNLGDMNIWGKHTLYEPSLKSTLIIKDPKIKGGVVNDRIVATVDIYPTIMELCDIQTNYHLDGDSMVSLLHNPKCKSWRDNAYSYWDKGITLRIPQYRATTFCDKDKSTTLLFEYKKNKFERVNIADNEEALKEALIAKLRDGVHNNMLKF